MYTKGTTYEAVCLFTLKCEALCVMMKKVGLFRAETKVRKLG
jgi:hypothetical protein